MLQWENIEFMFSHELAAISAKGEKLRSRSKPLFTNKQQLLCPKKISSSSNKYVKVDIGDTIEMTEYFQLEIYMSQHLNHGLTWIYHIL